LKERRDRRRKEEGPRWGTIRAREERGKSTSGGGGVSARKRETTGDSNGEVAPKEKAFGGDQRNLRGKKQTSYGQRKDRGRGELGSFHQGNSIRGRPLTRLKSKLKNAATRSTSGNGAERPENPKISS